MWILNDEILFTNNTAERVLRGAKIKIKVLGQFTNLKNAQYFTGNGCYI